ncbi:hypothetical protein BGX23_005587 [Mortierella sp. AD031]|nr:hypothetical protein BGX23_005587 [Mortierella sp. AD031]
MSGQICQFFLRGNCKYGDRCRNVHQKQFGSNAFGGGGGFASSNSFSALSGNSGNSAFGGSGFGGSSTSVGGGNTFGQRGFGGGGGFGGSNNNTAGSAFGSSGAGTAVAPAPGAKKIAFDANTISNDLTNDRPLYEYSSYGPGKEEPNLITGKDMQPEELRLMYYEAQNHTLTQATGDYGGLVAAATAAGAGPAGMQTAFMQKLQQLTMGMDQEIQTILNNPQGAYNNFMTTVRGAGAGGAGTGSTFGQNSAFGQTSTLGGGGAQNSAFGQPSTFGQPSSLGGGGGAQNSAFGQISAFGQPSTLGGAQNSAFGQTSALGGGTAGQSAFGTGGNTFASAGTNSAFGNPSGNSAFGQTSTLGGGGGGGNSAFGQPSVFGQQSATNPFGGGAGAGAGGSAFGQPSAFGGSGFLGGGGGGQAANNAFGQSTAGGVVGNAFGTTAQPLAFGGSSQGALGMSGGAGALGMSGGAGAQKAKDTSTVSEGTRAMVEGATIKFSKPEEPLTEDETAAFKAPAFQLKCIPEKEPPMELR